MLFKMFQQAKSNRHLQLKNSSRYFMSISILRLISNNDRFFTHSCILSGVFEPT